MRSGLHNASRTASQGHLLNSPRLYELTVEFFFMGRRRSTYRALVAAAGIRTGQHVLDVGCGTGHFARLIAETMGTGGLVVGIDPSVSMIEYARRNTRANSNCEFQVGAAQALPFPAEHFDAVTTSLVLHHLPEDLRARTLREIWRVLRPGGRLVVAEARNPQHGSVWGLLARAHGFDRMARQVPHLEPLAAAAGFSCIRRGEARPWLRYITAVKG